MQKIHGKGIPSMSAHVTHGRLGKVSDIQISKS